MELNRSDAGDMRAHVLDTAEVLLRRHERDKLNVVDVARAMNLIDRLEKPLDSSPSP